MLEQPNPFLSIAGAVRDALDPLTGSLQSVEGFSSLLLRYGWVPPDLSALLKPVSSDQPNKTPLSAIQATLAVPALMTALSDAIDKADSTGSLEDIAAAVEKAGEVLAHLRKAITAPGAWPAPLDRADFWSAFLGDVANGLLLDYLEFHHSAIFALLYLAGVVDRQARSSSDPRRVTYHQPVFHWELLGEAILAPRKRAERLYGWGADFNFDEFARRLQKVLLTFGIPASQGWATHPLLPRYYAEQNPSRPNIRQLTVPLFTGNLYTVGRYHLALALLPIPPVPRPNATAKPAGLLVAPVFNGDMRADIDLGAHWSLKLNTRLQDLSPVGVEILPDHIDLTANSVTKADAGLMLTYQPMSPWVLVNQPVKLTIDSVALGLEFKASPNADELIASLGWKKLQLSFNFGGLQSDSLITTLLGQSDVMVTVGGTITWSSKSGFGFNGQGALVFSVPINKKVAVAEIKEVFVGLELQNNQLTGFAAVVGTATLGPVNITVDQVGINLGATNDQNAVLGGLKLAHGFRSPKGLGLSIDAGPVSGGGYLYIDKDRGQYAGILHLEFATLQLTAAGILSTRYPDGKPGVAFIAVVTVGGFNIQIGFGFALTSLGGLFGLNHTANTDVLQAGLKSGVLNSILSLPDPISNAPRIISDLAASFPSAPGRYVFGPSLEIDWGTPAIIKAYIGLVLELPPPIRVLILGQIKSDLPKREQSLVRFRMDVLGIIDLAQQQLSIFASIYDSGVLNFTLSGDMALEMGWGTRPNFLLSLGGYHPQFAAPPAFPRLNRLTAGLHGGSSFQLRLEAYFALTSNSVQFGSHVDISVSVGKLSLLGYFGLDTLFKFSPFHFLANIRAGFAIKYDGHTLLGVAVALSLSGPAPWHAKGVATFTILIFDISAHFDVTFGPVDQLPPPLPIDVTEKIKTALQQPANWSMSLPLDEPLYVTLLPISGSDLVVYPRGLLKFSQRDIPLNQPITRYGTAPVANGPVTVNLSLCNMAPDQQQPISDYFAPGQFLDLTDTERIAGHSYELMQSGLEFGVNRYTVYRPSNLSQTPSEYNRPLCYNSIVLDGDQSRFVDCTAAGAYQVPGTALPHHLKVSAHEHSILPRNGLRKYRGAPSKIKVNPLSFKVVSIDTRALVANIPQGNGGYAFAREALRLYAERDPAAAKNAQVVQSHEVG